jgi:uncharacterized membrane protein
MPRRRTFLAILGTNKMTAVQLSQAKQHNEVMRFRFALWSSDWRLDILRRRAFDQRRVDVAERRRPNITAAWTARKVCTTIKANIDLNGQLRKPTLLTDR